MKCRRRIKELRAFIILFILTLIMTASNAMAANSIKQNIILANTSVKPDISGDAKDIVSKLLNGLISDGESESETDETETDVLFEKEKQTANTVLEKQAQVNTPNETELGISDEKKASFKKIGKFFANVNFEDAIEQTTRFITDNLPVVCTIAGALLGFVGGFLFATKKKKRLKDKHEQDEDIEKTTEMVEKVCGQNSVSNALYDVDEDDDEDTTALIRDVVPTRFHVTLVNEANPEDKHEIELSNSIIIGRKPVCDIVLENDKSVSGKHCRVFINEGLVFIEDMGSTNGTSVNDTKISEATEIRTGDVIAMGRKRFIVSIQK